MGGSKTLVALRKLDKQLPNTLHELLAVALEDFKKTVRRKDTDVDMNEWLKPVVVYGEGVYCAHCVAGAVLYQRLGPVKISSHLWSGPFRSNTTAGEPKVMRKMRAIDHLRQGLVYRAGKELSGRTFATKVQHAYHCYVEVPEYDPAYTRPWWKAMRKLQRELEEHEL